MTALPAIRIEGGLLGPEVVDGDLPGQKPADFGLDDRRSLTDEIAATFADSRKLWEVFQHRLQRLPEHDLATSVTRDAWAIPFFGLLGIDAHYNPRAHEVDGMSFAISHRMGEPADSPPLHIVGARQELGRVPASGRPRLAPHSLVQEYLNRTEHLWGMVTNGLTLRLLRNSTFIRRQAYIEFDLQTLLEEQRFNDFAALYRLLHRTRFPRGLANAHDCWLETYYQQSIQQGGRVREHLRKGVEKAITLLANGFLASSPALSRSEPLTLYRQLLRLIYRCLFLLVAEERGLMGTGGGDSGNRRYEHYGVSRLRRLCENRAAYTDDHDLWLSLRALWVVLTDEKMAALLDVPPLNGELFAHQDLDDAVITNRDLLSAFWYLAFYQEGSAPRRRVNYAALDTEELGSVYESLLDYHPTISLDSRGKPTFALTLGSERKSTGSYYTPPALVSELVKSVLKPALEEKLRAAREQSSPALEQALLSIKVLDPACGSGHFLLAAARRLGKELARIRSGEDEPAPERVREAARDVVAHCLYGVDKNPLAVELCRVALWLEAHCEGKPLTFLDHRIRCGDSLVGVMDLTMLKKGIPAEAFEPVTGDDKQVARSLKKRNQSERTGQRVLDFDSATESEPAKESRRVLLETPDDTPEQIRRKAQALQEWEQKTERLCMACHLWTSAFFQKFLPAPSARGTGTEGLITTETVRRYLESGTAHGQALGIAGALAQQNRFFHWPLEFPEVFATPSQALPLSSSPALHNGFDVILGNPPWERIKLQEEEFFANRDAAIARAPNAAARKRLIASLPQTNPALWQDYQRALHNAESASRFLRGGGQYPLTGRGDINTYSVFAERVRTLLNPQGRAGIIVPTGIATDATNQFFFADLVEKRQLLSLFDFENREALFPGVHRSYKFCLLTLAGEQESKRAGEDKTSHALTFSFFATRAEHLRDSRRVFSLTAADIARINPNTRTLPVFRTRQDADLTRAIYQRAPVLVNERTDENPWGVQFKQGLFNMSSDSHLFRTRAELEAQGCRLVGNVFVKGDHHSPSATRYSPLYEAKMLWHYDHRYGTYEGVSNRASTQLPTPDERQHADPHFVVQPWYWVPVEEVQARLGEWKRGWLLGFRDVTNATNERTAIFSLLPRVGAGHTLPILLVGDISALHISSLLANLNILTFDWVLRQKIGGMHLTFFILRQLPVLPPDAYTPEDLRFIVPRVLELTYTAWDLQPFAQDVWNEADAPLRAVIGPHPPSPSPKALGEGEQGGEGFPFPPFPWNESRRAVLRAELDAYYARLYGLTRKQLRYILDPADLTERELADLLDPWEEVADPLDPQGYAARVAASTFPGETFRVLKEKEQRQLGEYRTRRLVLEAWEKMTRSVPSPDYTNKKGQP